MFKKIIFIILLLFFKDSFSKDFINVTTKVKNGISITLDACGGSTDLRILNFLIENKIPSTIFVTSKWIKNNEIAISLINNNNHLFSIQNHGLEHKEAVFSEIGAYNLPTVKNNIGLEKEVIENISFINSKFINQNNSIWYRTAGALYDKDSILWLQQHNIKIAGYTIAVDEGGTASYHTIINNITKAKSGDVLLVHLNKPNSFIFNGFEIGVKELIKNNNNFIFLN